MTQSASWMDLSASSKTRLFEPLTRIETVFAGLWIPVTFTILDEPRDTSSASSAPTKFSLVKWSNDAIGRQPRV